MIVAVGWFRLDGRLAGEIDLLNVGTITANTKNYRLKTFRHTNHRAKFHHFINVEFLHIEENKCSRSKDGHFAHKTLSNLEIVSCCSSKSKGRVHLKLKIHF